MNKETLVGELKRIRDMMMTPLVTSEAQMAAADAYDDAYLLAKKLDEEDEPMVPQFVADWFEEHKHELEYAIHQLSINFQDGGPDGGMSSWFGSYTNKPIETLIKMKKGYKVETKTWVVKVGTMYIKSYTNGALTIELTSHNGSAYKCKDENEARTLAEATDGNYFYLNEE